MSDSTTSHLDSFSGGVIDLKDGQVCAFNQAAHGQFPSLALGAPLPQPLAQLLDAPQESGQFLIHSVRYRYSRIPVGDHLLLHLHPVTDHIFTQRQLDDMLREVRTHLQVILTGIQSLERSCATHSQKELLILYKSFCRLQRLTSNLQLCREMEQPGGLPFQPRAVAFSSLLRELAMETESLLAPLDISLDYESIVPALILPGDSQLLSKLVLSLLSNAIKQTPKGGTITLALWVQDNSAHLTIQDGAPASRPLNLDVLLSGEPPERKLPDPQDGIGLGLKLAHRIVALHHGTMEALLAPDCRFKWHITLPLTPLPTRLGVQQPPSGMVGFSLTRVELADVLPPSAFATEPQELPHSP